MSKKCQWQTCGTYWWHVPFWNYAINVPCHLRCPWRVCHLAVIPYIFGNTLKTITLLIQSPLGSDHWILTHPMWPLPTRPCRSQTSAVLDLQRHLVASPTAWFRAAQGRSHHNLKNGHSKTAKSSSKMARLLPLVANLSCQVHHPNPRNRAGHS